MADRVRETPFGMNAQPNSYKENTKNHIRAKKRRTDHTIIVLAL